MEFTDLGEPERRLLLTALEINILSLQCYHCKEEVSYKTCAILPALKKEKSLATIACNSPLCISHYLIEQENEKPSYNHILKSLRTIVGGSSLSRPEHTRAALKKLIKDMED